MSGIRHRRRHSLAAGLAAAVALFLVPTTAIATAATAATPTAAAAAASGPAAAVEHAVPRADSARLTEYWTPERMARAVPAERVGRAPQGAPAVPAPPRKPTGPAATGSDPVAGGAPAPGGIGIKVSATQVVGKVFFTGSDGKDYVCSGSAVNSTNKNMVFTAGHCVHGGPGQSWNSNWQFVPYYDHGNRPYGTWSAETLVAFNGWTQSGNFGYDLGIVITAPNSSGELVNAVGGLGLQWNQSKDRYVTSMGYPQAPPFDGQWQYFCGATSSQRSASVADQIKIPCNMTGGSSGGPWIFGKDDNVYYSGWVNGVNSNVDSATAPTQMRSPYFATWVGDAFNTYSSY
ncbi:hypothetical protein [Streptomyces sp. NPDC048659]|uniref:trypsin-like serine peptidase n=1 Tax=Streptomyces sp. NPDC048659 TaxID=3155489 RepID=UPI0034327C3D